jgi:ribosome recycling factor
MTFTKADYEKRMHGALEALAREFAGLRTGRASPNLLDPVMVEAYGSKMPLTQVGTVSVPEARLISVQVWDKGMVKSVEKAIREAGLGLNPSADGTLVRIPIPDLSEERRKELVKVAAKYAEQGKVAVRNVRRDAMEHLKKLHKDSALSEDELHRFEEEIQKLTDSFIAQVDTSLSKKEKDILSV